MTQTSLGLSDAEFLEKDPAELLAEKKSQLNKKLNHQIKLMRIRLLPPKRR